MKAALTGGAVAAMALLLSACGSWVDVKPQAREIVTLDQARVGNCHYLGKVDVSVLKEAGFFKRSPKSVETDLTNLARNSAVSLGGDTVSPLAPQQRGKQAFGVYRCLNAATAANPPAPKQPQPASGFKTIPYQPPGL